MAVHTTAHDPGAQRRIGLTGGIASGKSSVGSYLAARGLPVLDADRYAHDALAPGSETSEAILDRYGKRVEAGLGQTPQSGPAIRSINRRALGAIVFNTASERRWLEQLVHPLVCERFEQELMKHHQAETVVLMIPLLFEAGLTRLCSEIWVVNCTEAQQLERLQQRDGLDVASARARIKAQWPLSQKCKLADVVLDNRGESECWEGQIKEHLALAA